MTYRSLLVLLDQSPLCDARTQAALRLAQRLDAHLVGLAPTGRVDLPAAVDVDAGQPDFGLHVWQRMFKELRAQADAVAARFEDQCRAAGARSFETVVDEDDTARSAIAHAHCSDLVLASQADPDAPGAVHSRDLLEQVVLYSARPTLLLPYASPVQTPGSRVLVAWDDSREAARALSDALPLLRQAEQVQVINWSEKGALADAKRQARLDALGQWLSYHGVAAQVHAETASASIADTILSRAADVGADLVVMGAWGHARWAERVLGGATRGILSSMTVPVLMSH